jgi:two-component system response regulator MprA
MAKSEIILVVDDTEMALTLVRDSLAKGGFTVRTASDGFEALVAIEKERPALIIADIMMPRLSGLDLLKAVRNRPETRGIPFIMLSALDKAESVQAGLDLGADDYLTKPFKVGELLGKVRHFLKRRPEE